jgi:hypothetical protein
LGIALSEGSLSDAGALSPSLTHLFGDEVRIREALEADRRRPYQASFFPSRPSFNPHSSNSQEGWARRRKSNKKPYNSKKSSYRRPAGKADGPASKKGEGQKKQWVPQGRQERWSRA